MGFFGLFVFLFSCEGGPVDGLEVFGSGLFVSIKEKFNSFLLRGFIKI